MAVGLNYLVVEGEKDKNFFEAVCANCNLKTKVQVANPSHFGEKFNSKQGVINRLNLLVSQLYDGSVKRLGIVIDSDYIKDGGGFQRAVDQVSAALSAHGYSATPRRMANSGLSFTHPDGLPDVGVWVMPDNSSEGAFEEWLSSTIHSSQLALFQSAENSVQNIQNKLFPATHNKKAVTATWLAWQRKPGERASYAFANNLLDIQSSSFSNFINWLHTNFS